MRVLVDELLSVLREQPRESEAVWGRPGRLRRSDAVSSSLVKLTPDSPVREPAELEDDELDAW